MSVPSLWKLGITVFMAILFTTNAALPQTTTGTILGTITDPSGAAMPGVRVLLINLDTGLRRETTSNHWGDYALPDLPLGRYRLTADAHGFETLVREGVELHVQEKARIDLVMKVGSTSERVTVKAPAPLVSTDDSTQKQLINNQMMVDLPLNGRNFTQLALLAPNVQPGVPGSTLETFLGAGISVWANGQREFNNLWNLDGANMNIGYYSWNAFNPSVDAIQEFTIQTGMYPAQFGYQGGANINIAIKSGTNQLHGSLYEFFRNDSMDARNFFTSTRPALHQNQFGGTIGGPVDLPKLYNGRDKTFFFVSYEGFRNLTQALGLETVPTAAERGGDLTHTFSGAPFTGKIIDPLTGKPFAGNVIPSSRITPQTLKILNYYPLPNTTGKATYNDYVLAPVPNNTDQAIARVDERIGDNDTLFGHYAQSRIYRPAAQFIPSFFTTTALTAHNVTLSYTHLFPPRTLNNLQMSFNRSYVTQTDPRANTSFNIEQALGIPGINASGTTAGFPLIGILNYTSIGDPTGDPLIQPDQVFQVADNLNLERGRHNLTLGTDIWHLRSDRFQGVNIRGSFSFVNSNPVGTGNSFADFLLGLPEQTALGEAPGQEHLRNERYSAYVQDDWKATSRLTLNIGLRYELPTVVSDTRGTVASFDLATGKVIYFAPGQGLYKPYHEDWAPRFGFAYRPFGGDKTVVRGGYGLFYNIPLNGALLSLDQNPPFATQATYFASGAAAPITLGNPFPSAVQGAPTATPNISAVDPNYRPARIETASLGVERQLTPNTSLDVNFVDSLTFGLDRLVQPNSALPGPGAVQPRRPFPNYGVINVVQTSARAWYYGATAELQHRFSHDWQVLSSYTYSRTLDQSFSGVAGQPNDSSYPQNSRDLRAEEGLAATDRRNRWVSSFVYTLPFGPGQKYLSSGLAGKVIGGWQVTGIYTAQSGEVFGVNLAGDPINQGSPNNVARPNRLADGNLSGSARSITHWFDTAAFVSPGPFTFGNAGRAFLIGPAFFNLDAGILKNFSLGEQREIQFRAESFNALNHTNFDIPGRYVGTSSFGIITSAEPARIMQLSLKFIF